jgi:hypothetical protein
MLVECVNAAVGLAENEITRSSAPGWTRLLGSDVHRLTREDAVKIVRELKQEIEACIALFFPVGVLSFSAPQPELHAKKKKATKVKTTSKKVKSIRNKKAR